MGYKLSPVDVATTIVDGLKNDYAVIECNMAYVIFYRSLVDVRLKVDIIWALLLLYSTFQKLLVIMYFGLSFPLLTVMGYLQMSILVWDQFMRRRKWNDLYHFC